MALVKWSIGESYLQSKPQDKPRDVPQDRHIGLGITEHNPREDAEKRESLNIKLNERYLVKRATIILEVHTYVHKRAKKLSE